MSGPSISEELLLRLGETEYGTVDPRYTRATPFGTFYSHPDFPDRYDANQLCRVSCSPAAVPELLAQIDACYASLGLDFRKISGHEPDVWAHLADQLTSRGWSTWACEMMIHSTRSARESNPEVEIRSVQPESVDLELLFTAEDGVDRGFELARSQFPRMGGEYLVGYLDGEPAGCTGWFVQAGVARFRHVLTASWARGRGCATSLIHHVQRHPVIQEQEALVIFVGTDGPQRLYNELGFRKVGRVWEAKLAL